MLQSWISLEVSSINMGFGRVKVHTSNLEDNGLRVGANLPICSGGTLHHCLYVGYAVLWCKCFHRSYCDFHIPTGTCVRQRSIYTVYSLQFKHLADAFNPKRLTISR